MRNKSTKCKIYGNIKYIWSAKLIVINSSIKCNVADQLKKKGDGVDFQQYNCLYWSFTVEKKNHHKTKTFVNFNQIDWQQILQLNTSQKKDKCLFDEENSMRTKGT